MKLNFGCHLRIRQARRVKQKSDAHELPGRELRGSGMPQHHRRGEERSRPDDGEERADSQNEPLSLRRRRLVAGVRRISERRLPRLRVHDSDRRLRRHDLGAGEALWNRRVRPRCVAGMHARWVSVCRARLAW